MKDGLYLSTISEAAPSLARACGVGLELTEFCYGGNLDEASEEYTAVCRGKMEGIARFWFHGPFAELCPAAIDPLIRQVTARRYTQALEKAGELGAARVVLHGGFVPQIYDPRWFVPEAVKFWQTMLDEFPAAVTVALENVMEPEPELLTEIVRQVDDPRLRLCLDVGHANLTKTPLPRWIESMAPWLCHVHLHNNDGITDQHQELDQGRIAMRSVLEALEEQCPGAAWTLEVQDGHRSLNWLEKEGYL